MESLFDIEARLPRTVSESSMIAPQALKTESAQAIIQVDGVLFPKSNILTFFGFGTALSDIQALMTQAASDPQVKKIVLNFSSPGGSVTGVNELANAIKAMNKPTVAYVSGMAASAAYWLAAACDEIVIDATATLGSIGVVGIYSAKSKREIEIVSSNAPHKRPDLETDAGRSVAQSHVDALESVFVSALSQLRPSLSQDRIKALGGDVRVGANAVQAGLADGLGSLQGIMQGQQASKPALSALADDEIQAAHGWKQAADKVSALRGGGNGVKPGNGAKSIKTAQGRGKLGGKEFKKPTQAGESSGGWGGAIAKFKRDYGR
nr:S49 family peptidase [Methylomarinum sp. Ch1-1]MDP4521312.1 S49 family peptidase [Methylomarinum sp. Ch1-1]